MGIGWIRPEDVQTTGGENMPPVRRQGKVVAHGNGTVQDLTPSMQKEVLPLEEKKLTYLIVRCLDRDSPRIFGKYDFFVCPWGDSTILLNDYTDSLQTGEIANISLQVVEWTEKERDAWFYHNNVEITSRVG
jgi:hypothetical protein